MSVLSYLPPQKPLAATSSLAPSVVFALRPESLRLITCSSGSTWTLLQTSVKSTAVRSLISLWRSDGKPPRGHDSRCSTAKAAPHSQYVGGLVGAQPYRNAKASTKASLCRQKPCSLMGRDVSQLEAPGWLARSMALDRAEDNCGRRVDAVCVTCSRRSRLMLRLAVIWSAYTW